VHLSRPKQRSGGAGSSGQCANFPARRTHSSRSGFYLSTRSSCRAPLPVVSLSPSLTRTAHLQLCHRHVEQPPPKDAPFIEQMRHRLSTGKGRQAYDLRKSTIELVFVNINQRGAGVPAVQFERTGQSEPGMEAGESELPPQAPLPHGRGTAKRVNRVVRTQKTGARRVWEAKSTAQASTIKMLVPS